MVGLTINLLPYSDIDKTKPTTIVKNKKTGDFSPVMIQLFKIKPIHRFRLQCNHLQ